MEAGYKPVEMAGLLVDRLPGDEEPEDTVLNAGRI